MTRNRLFPASLAPALLALTLFVTLAACSRHTHEVYQDNHHDIGETMHPLEDKPQQDTRRVIVSGKVIGVPATAQATQTLMAGKILNEDEVDNLTGGDSPNRMLVSPKMTVANGDTGRFKLGIENSTAAIQITLTPTIEADGQVQLNPGIEATGADGRRDSLKDSSLVQPNTGRYTVFGPLSMDDQVVYTILKADVLPQ